VPVCVTAFAFQSGQPDCGSGIADNALYQRLDKGFNTFNIWFFVVFNRFTDAVKLLLNTQIGEGGDAQFGGYISADRILGAISVHQFMTQG